MNQLQTFPPSTEYEGLAGGLLMGSFVAVLLTIISPWLGGWWIGLTLFVLIVATWPNRKENPIDHRTDREELSAAPRRDHQA